VLGDLVSGFLGVLKHLGFIECSSRSRIFIHGFGGVVRTLAGFPSCMFVGVGGSKIEAWINQ
jgi:hypothetical protein